MLQLPNCCRRTSKVSQLSRGMAFATGSYGRRRDRGCTGRGDRSSCMSVFARKPGETGFGWRLAPARQLGQSAPRLADEHLVGIADLH